MTGQEFQRIRKDELCWTQEMMARALHISQQAVSDIERSDHVKQAYRLAILYLMEEPEIVTMEM